MRAVAVLVTLAVAGSASAQTVTLRGWAVPDGFAVCGRSVVYLRHEVTEGPDTLWTTGVVRAGACWSAFEAQDGLLVDW